MIAIVYHSDMDELYIESFEEGVQFPHGFRVLRGMFSDGFAARSGIRKGFPSADRERQQDQAVAVFERVRRFRVIGALRVRRVQQYDSPEVLINVPGFLDEMGHL